MMKNNFYPITIIKKDNLFIASIAELGISVSGKNHADTVEECIAQKNKILKQLEEKGISFPDVIYWYCKKPKSRIFSKVQCASSSSNKYWSNNC